MSRRGYIIIGALLLLFVSVTLVVFRVSGSQDSVFVEGCTPYNITIKKEKDEKSVNVSWQTKERCSGYILYGGEMRELDLVGVDLVNDVKSKSHTVVLTSLLRTKRYYFTIVSGDITYGKNGLPIQFSISSL